LQRHVFWYGTEVAVASVINIALMMEAVKISETLVNFYRTTRRYSPP
jgi:hypothetical protein